MKFVTYTFYLELSQSQLLWFILVRNHSLLCLLDIFDYQNWKNLGPARNALPDPGVAETRLYKAFQESWPSKVPSPELIWRNYRCQIISDLATSVSAYRIDDLSVVAYRGLQYTSPMLQDTRMSSNGTVQTEPAEQSLMSRLIVSCSMWLVDKWLWLARPW